MASISSMISIYISLFGCETWALRQGILETVPVGNASDSTVEEWYPPLMAWCILAITVGGRIKSVSALGSVVNGHP